MRRKPWARPELAACPFFVDNPSAYRGKWHSLFAGSGPLHIELGCGKGAFLAQIAPLHPEIRFLGVDIKSEVLVVAKRAVEAQYPNNDPVNVRLTAQDIERISMMLSPEDVVDRLYIHFCNPWSRRPYHKKRLTHLRQLLCYRDFLRDGGEIWFKTDDAELFSDSLSYFYLAGYSISYQTEDLHNSGFSPNYQTEHERMFTAQGIPIRFCMAVKDREPLLTKEEAIRWKEDLSPEGLECV